MEINPHQESKLVEVWLTNSEKRDAELRERLKPLYREYKEKDYLVAVFESGTQDLAELDRNMLVTFVRRIDLYEGRRIHVEFNIKGLKHG